MDDHIFERNEEDSVSVTLSGLDCAIVIRADGSSQIFIPRSENEEFISIDGGLFKVAILNSVLNDPAMLKQIGMSIIPADESSGCRSGGPGCDGCTGDGGCDSAVHSD